MMSRCTLCLSLASVACGKTYFKETFSNDGGSPWTTRKWKGDEPELSVIQTGEGSKFVGVYGSFESFSNEGKELIVQYQAKYEKDVECSGGFLMLGPKMIDAMAFGDKPYKIMFGSEQCGFMKERQLIFNSDTKNVLKWVDLIVNHVGKNVLKKADKAYKQEGEVMSHVYRVILNPVKKTVRVEVDKVKIFEGSLTEDDRAYLKPKEISDLDDEKPSDWVVKRIVDKEATKKIEDPVKDILYKNKRIAGKDASQKIEDLVLTGDMLYKKNTRIADDVATKNIEDPVKDDMLYKNKRNAGKDATKKIEDPALKGDMLYKKNTRFADKVATKDDMMYKNKRIAGKDATKKIEDLELIKGDMKYQKNTRIADKEASEKIKDPVKDMLYKNKRLADDILYKNADVGLIGFGCTLENFIVTDDMSKADAFLKWKANEARV